MLELQDYHFVPIHRAGVSHNNANALSRLQREDDEIKNDSNNLIMILEVLSNLA